MDYTTIRIRKADYERIGFMKGYLSITSFVAKLLDEAEQPTTTEDPKTEYKVKRENPRLKSKKTDPRFTDVKNVFFEEWEKNNSFKFSSFGPGDGAALKQLIKKLDNLNESDMPITDFFRTIMQNLPHWYKSQSIKVINGKFSELIAEIKNGKQSSGDSWNNIRPEHDWRL